MSRPNSILLSRDAREGKWQLPRSPSGRLALVGWQTAEESVDAGVPEAVTSLLARALTTVALVTFPMSSELASTDETAVRLLEPIGIKAQLESAVSRKPSKIYLVSTRRPDIAKALFDDPAFPWWLQGQVVIVTPTDAPPPDLDRRSILSMIKEKRWLDRDTTTSIEAAAVIRPGVDGDVMGIAAGAEDFERALLESIQREASRSGFACQIASEAEFAEGLARPGDD